MLLLKKLNFFLYLFPVKEELEIRFNDVVDRKQTFFSTIKAKFFQRFKNGIFPNGLTHAFGQKTLIFSLFVFGQNKTRYNAQGKKEAFLR